MIRLHVLQHVAFEGPARIEDWARRKGHILSGTRVDQTQDFPSMGSFDWLVIMGGPMNIYEEDLHPWLAEEKKFIRAAIDAGKVALGICLGAQLVADVLGGHVYKNHHKEIGWHPVFLTPKARKSPVFGGLPENFEAFHWHGDTFDLPPQAVRMIESEGCLNQAFEYDGRVFGLQCHLESSPESVGALVERCGDELVQGKFIQDKRQILSSPDHFKRLETYLDIFLDSIETNTRQN
jgi:GMP synthase (glutamine-hydrolysing)